MNLSEIHTLAQKLNPHYKGIAANFCPGQPNSLWFVYVQGKHRVGHLVAVYTNNRNEVFFFDSLGEPPAAYKIAIENAQQLRQPIQDEKSCTCGSFVLYFAHLTSSPMFDAKMLEHLYISINRNTEFILDWLEQHTGKKWKQLERC